MTANETMDTIHKTRVPEPHRYLMIVGVDPELQNQGVGSAIVREGLALADRESVRCYLETSERRNLAFYERHGFVVLEEAKDTPCGGLKSGNKVDAKGTRQADNSVLATSVEKD